MPNIIDPQAIAFANNWARPMADRLARAYYACVGTSDEWVANGSGAAALAVPQIRLDIRSTADRLVAAYETSFRCEKIWFLGVNLLFPNDSSPVYDNGSFSGQDPNRTPITGQAVNGLMNRVVQFQNWLFSATQSFTDTARNNAAAYNTALQASNDGPPTLVLADAGNLINRCNELKTNYQTSSNQNLSTLLAVAINPRS